MKKFTCYNLKVVLHLEKNIKCNQWLGGWRVLLPDIFGGFKTLQKLFIDEDNNIICVFLLSLVLIYIYIFLFILILLL